MRTWVSLRAAGHTQAPLAHEPMAMRRLASSRCEVQTACSWDTSPSTRSASSASGFAASA